MGRSTRKVSTRSITAALAGRGRLGPVAWCELNSHWPSPIQHQIGLIAYPKDIVLRYTNKINHLQGDLPAFVWFTPWTSVSSNISWLWPTSNFTRASEVLHIAQPPLSRQIQLLEEELGVQLIPGNSRPLRGHGGGARFYERALQIINRLDQLKTATRQIGLQQRETVSIGFVPLLCRWSPDAGAQAAPALPRCGIQPVELTSTQQIGARQAALMWALAASGATIPRWPARCCAKNAWCWPYSSRFALAANNAGHISLSELNGQSSSSTPSEPRPSFADHVLSFLNDQDIRPSVNPRGSGRSRPPWAWWRREYGLCLIPASARLRSDLHYRLIDDPRITSPIILEPPAQRQRLVHRRRQSAARQ